MIILGFPSNKITLGINIYKLLYRCYRSYALNLKLEKKSVISINKIHLGFFPGLLINMMEKSLIRELEYQLV